LKTVLILGGGITGLSTAYELEKHLDQHKDVNLMLAEASSILGGKIRTVKQDGFIMETGADSIVTRKINHTGIIEELDLEDEVVYNAVGTSYLYVDGTLKQIPADSVFGIPASMKALVESELVSAKGKVEALKDYYTNDRQFSGADSIGEFLSYYLGKELTEKQIAPVLSGVYSGNLNDLSIQSTMPYLLDYKKRYGSILKGIEVNKEQFLGHSEKKFLSFKNGLSTIIDGFAKKLNHTKIRLNHEATEIKRSENGYVVQFRNGEEIQADYIVLSIPHNAAERLFSDRELTNAFSEIQMNSIISVYLGYHVPNEILPENGTGFITTSNESLVCGACTWSSRKWQHTSQNGNLLIRLFYKNNHPKFSEIKKMSESELINLALQDIEKSLKLKEKPVVCNITKWTDLMPTYDISHPETVKKLEKIFENNFQGIFIAGCSYYGAGISDCIENGKETAKKIVHTIYERVD
jgi:protoporphyrinogen/coproporphyrinogen III oxidase